MTHCHYMAENDNANKTDKGNEGKEPDKPDTSKDDGKNSASDADERKFTQAELDAAISKRLNEEKKRIEKKSKEDSLSETEKLKLQAETAQQELRVLKAKDAFNDEASKAKAKNPTKLYRLFKNDLLFSEDGEATNIKALIQQAKRDYPDEFETAKGNADGGAGRGSAGKVDVNSIIRRKAGINA